MKAIILEQTGPAENLKLKEVPTPTATPGHVVVKVHGCGVCYRDLIDRRGGFAFIQTPITPGHELAGEVVEVGAGVRRWRVGDRVISVHRDYCGACDPCQGGDERDCTGSWESFGLTVNGGYAEYALCGENALVEVPASIGWAEAATIMCTSGVAYHKVHDRARVQMGERVLITGATGGVGTQALQIAKLAGATTYAVTSSPSKVDKLKELGADHVLVSEDGAFHKQLKMDHGEMDAAIECVGGATFNSSLRSLRRGGRVVVIGNIQGEPVSVNLGLLVVGGASVIGSDALARRAVRDAVGLVAQGKLRPVVAGTLPLAKAAEAHRTLEERGVFGRLVLVP
ncbi:MAG: zinc-binding dehydrogenase [Myxococcales bacterium]|nr:zinc-binding dehydrogenase [Myxococcales bacterium]